MKMDITHKNIVLTGFMASGKTTVGKMLAEELNRPFIDTDVFIEAKAGMSIAEIFAEKGETAFRRMEQQTAAELAQYQGVVLATGGRMVLDPANVASLGKTGTIVCLKASPKEILSRVMSDGQQLRPLLAVPDPESKIKELLEERRTGYAQFPQVMTDGKTQQTIVDEILAVVKETDRSENTEK